MALKVDDMYWRIYADHKLQIYTLTCVPLSEPTHHELVSHENTLKAIAKGLQAVGWKQYQRRTFELLVRLNTATP